MFFFLYFSICIIVNLLISTNEIKTLINWGKHVLKLLFGGIGVKGSVISFLGFDIIIFHYLHLCSHLNNKTWEHLEEPPQPYCIGRSSDILHCTCLYSNTLLDLIASKTKVNCSASYIQYASVQRHDYTQHSKTRTWSYHLPKCLKHF